MLSSIKRILLSKGYKASIIAVVCILLVSNIEWFIDEYIRDINHFSIFNKLFIVRNETIGSEIYYWLFPLFSGCACVNLFSKNKEESECGFSTIITQCTTSFLIGFSIVFVSVFIDYWMLSMITESFYPMPNDMTTMYNSTKLFSRLYFKYPRLFILIWSTLLSFWGGSFSLLFVGLYYVLKNVFTALTALITVYLANYYVSIICGITPWKYLLCAGSFADISFEAIILNNLAVISCAFIMILLFYDRKCKNEKI
ncbi:MAG: hypothetical protein IKN85_00545 [Oscillospiraceae bacterium]|nr:hypothetical protein [Oscillospiraceae bacterium]MBR3534291.1 hypothetical protein [Oscillospiraceae bacterium]MBR6837070.1 hypothetical protein [Oscillospiraceae bacterium]